MGTKQIVINNKSQGTRIIKSYRNKGIAYRLTDDSFKDENGNSPVQRFAKLVGGNNIFDAEQDKYLLRFLIGEEGTTFMGCPEVKNSRAYNELVKSGQPVRESKLEYIDVEKNARDREQNLGLQKEAVILLARVLDNEQLTKDICYAMRHYNNEATSSMYEADLTEAVMNSKKHKQFMEMFKDTKAKGKDLAIKDDLLNLSLFRQGMAKGLISIKDNAYYNGTVLLGYQEGTAVVTLVEDKEKWQFFLSQLKKVAQLTESE